MSKFVPSFLAASILAAALAPQVSFAHPTNDTLTIYRFFKGNMRPQPGTGGPRDRDRDRGGNLLTPQQNGHFYTTSLSEGQRAGFQYEPTGDFDLYRNPMSGRIALYRCLVPRAGDHFISTDPNCESRRPGDTVQEGLLGYANQYTNSYTSLTHQQLFRFRSQRTSDHLITKSADAERSGYISEGTLGYVPRTTVTVHRFANMTGPRGTTRGHFYTLNSELGTRAGMISEPRGNFQLYRSPGENRQALYACYVLAADDHFVSTDINCEGHVSEDLLGYADIQTHNRESPLLRFSGQGDHLITKDRGEGSWYRAEGQLGFSPDYEN